MKIKRTKSGNIRITMDEETALSLKDLMGKSNFTTRAKMLAGFGNDWCREEDDRCLSVYYAIKNLVEWEE